MIRLALALLLIALPVRAEEVVAGLSQNRVAITANFDGSEIVVFAAVARDAPVPEGRLDVIVTVEGPSSPVVVRRKARRFGIWVNVDAVQIDRAPAFYAIATTGPLSGILSETEDLRHRISVPKAIRAVGVAHQAEDAPTFSEALIRLRRQIGAYAIDEGSVLLDRNTLIRADIRLPANLSEGMFRTRIFLLRDGAVIAQEETVIDVHKFGLERFLHSLAMERPLIYGILSLLMAILAGWGASAAFTAIRR